MKSSAAVAAAAAAVGYITKYMVPFVRDYPTGVQVTFAPFDQLLAFFFFFLFSFFFALRTIENYRLFLHIVTQPPPLGSLS
jgi:hypothetical protein